MKKILFAFLALCMIGAVCAQSLQMPSKEKERYTKFGTATEHVMDKGALGWFVYPYEIREFYGSANFEYYTQSVFPDSTVMVTYSDGAGGYTLGSVWQHAMGITFDARAELFGEFIYQNTPYTIDTLLVNAWYFKKTADVDTLYVEMVHGTAYSGPAFRSVYWSPTPPSTDTLWASPIQSIGDATQMGHKAFCTDPGKTVFKYVLTDDDTSGGTSKVIKIPVPTPYQVPGDEVAGISIAFVPGYTYNVGDVYKSNSPSYVSTINSFSAYYMYSGTGLQDAIFYDPYHNSANLSCYINSGQRYGTNGNFLDSIHSPTTERCWYIGCHVTAPIGIEETKTQDFVSLKQNMPNPCFEKTNITYNIEKNANVQLDIYDIAGRNVMSINEGDKPSGKHHIRVDASKLNDGIYYYTLTANNVRLTKKMMVSK